jgi:hypothetical protein
MQGSDPGVTISIYWPPITSYTIPGPPVFTCGGGSSKSLLPEVTLKQRLTFN